MDKKRQLAADNFDPSCSGDSAAAACGGISPLAVSNKAASTAAETSSANNAAGTVEDPHVLANPVSQEILSPGNSVAATEFPRKYCRVLEP